MADITIYLGNKNYSSWSLRAWLALKQTGVAFDEVVIPLYEAGSSAEIRRFSPSGRVPALRHDGTLVWDSLAICEYLAELFPGAGLWPVDRAARAVARSVSAEMHAGFPDLRQNLPMDLSRHQPHRSRVAAAQGDIDRVTAIWRDCRERFGRHGASGPKDGSRDFLFGGFSIADAMFAPVVSRFRTYGVALDPISAAYADAVWNWPAMREWAAAAEAEPWIITFDVFENGL